MAKNAVDCIIRYQGGIVLVERAHPPLGLALPGGKVEETESLEQAVEREVKEETGLSLANLVQMHTYSEPDRDPRGRMMSTVYTADGYGTLKAGDDASGVQVVPLSEINGLASKLVFDHYRIMSDYKRQISMPVASAQVKASPNGTYYVLWQRDAKMEKEKKYGANKQLYDCMRTFNSLGGAQSFAEEHLPAILAKRIPVEAAEIALVRDVKKPYIVIAEFDGKYRHYDYTGDSDPLTTYDVAHCTLESLDAVSERFANENCFKKLYRGLELRLFGGA